MITKTKTVRALSVGTRAIGTERGRWPMPATLIAKRGAGRNEYELTFEADNGDRGTDNYPATARIILA